MGGGLMTYKIFTNDGGKGSETHRQESSLFLVPQALSTFGAYLTLAGDVDGPSDMDLRKRAGVRKAERCGYRVRHSEPSEEKTACKAHLSPMNRYSPVPTSKPGSLKHETSMPSSR
jgi:hypothetical protein